MGEVLAELVAKITADATELKKGLGESEKAFESLSNVAKQTTMSWTEFLKGRMGPAMKQYGSHAAAMKELSTEYKEYKAGVQEGLTEIDKGVEETGKGVEETGKIIEKETKSWQEQFKAVGKLALGMGASVTGSLGMMTKAAIDEEVNIQRLSIALKNVGVNYDDVKDSLEAVFTATMKKTGIADNKQRDALNQLLIVTGDYQQALDLLPLTLDLTAAKQIDVSSAAMLLGRVAEGNMSTLVRYGIVLKEGATASEALAAIQEKVGGAAEATVNPFNVLKASMSDMSEKIGSFLLPTLTQLVNIIVPILEKVQAWADAHPELTKQIVLLAIALGVFLTFAGTLMLFAPMIAAAWTIAMGPVGLIVLAIAALIAIGILLWQNWDTIKTKVVEIWNGIAKFFYNVWQNITGIFKTHWALILAILFPAVGLPVLIAKNWGKITKIVADIWDTIVGFFKENWDKILAILFPAIGLPILIARNWGVITEVISNLWDGVMDILGGVPSRIGSVFATVKDIILSPFRAAWAGIETGINWLIRMLNTISFTIPGWVPIIGGQSFGINISEVSLPKFAEGGIVTQPTLAMIGEAGAEAVIPLNEMGAMGGITINFTQPVFFDREDTMIKFVDMIRKGIQRQDRLRFGGAYSG